MVRKYNNTVLREQYIREKAESDCVKMEAEIGLMQPQVRECQRPLAAGKGREWIFP